MDQDFSSRERRQYARKLLRTTAQLVDPVTGLIEARTTDISSGGIGVILNTDPIQTSTFLLRVALSQSDRRQVLLQAQVRVVNSVFVASEGGFKVGLRFAKLAPQAALALSQFLA